MGHTADQDAILASWDNGTVARELTTEQTIRVIARALRLRTAEVRAILVANGRIEEE